MNFYLQTHFIIIRLIISFGRIRVDHRGLLSFFWLSSILYSSCSSGGSLGSHAAPFYFSGCLTRPEVRKCVPWKGVHETWKGNHKRGCFGCHVVAKGGGGSTLPQLHYLHQVLGDDLDSTKPSYIFELSQSSPTSYSNFLLTFGPSTCGDPSVRHEIPPSSYPAAPLQPFTNHIADLVFLPRATTPVSSFYMFISSRKCLDVNSWLDFGTEKYAWDLAFGPTLAVCLNFQSLDSFTSTNLPRKA